MCVTTQRSQLHLIKELSKHQDLLLGRGSRAGGNALAGVKMQPLGTHGGGHTESECSRSLHHMPFSRLGCCPLVCPFYRKGDQEEE